MTPTEKTIAAVWSSLLRRNDLSLKSNFFESGGDSLQMMTMLIEVGDLMSVELMPGDFFETSTLREFAEFVEKQRMLTGGSISFQEGII